MISTRLYSKPPFCTKKPFGPCTLAIATAMVASTSSPASGVSRPATNSTPATSSPPTASPAHSRAGRNPRHPSNPVEPARPGPPNAPNAFWAPWARNTAPSVRRNASNPRSKNILPPPKRGGGNNYSNSRYLTSNKPGNKLPRLEVPGARMRRSPTAPTSPGATALKLWIVLARAFDAVDRHSRASIARFGLGTTEFGVLEVLYHKGELPVCEVQRRILVESSSTTYVVDKLCERGLVRRRPSSADRRVTLLALTPAGRRLIQQIFPPHAVAMRRAVGALPPREQGQAVRLLRALGKGATQRLQGKTQLP